MACWIWALSALLPVPRLLGCENWDPSTVTPEKMLDAWVDWDDRVAIVPRLTSDGAGAGVGGGRAAEGVPRRPSLAAERAVEEEWLFGWRVF